MKLMIVLFIAVVFASTQAYSQKFALAKEFTKTVPSKWNGKVLLPGKTYTVRLFAVLDSSVHVKECLSFVKNEDMLIAGSEGADFVTTYAESDLPFDATNGKHEVISLTNDSLGGIIFEINPAKDLNDDVYLLCFQEMK